MAAQMDVDADKPVVNIRNLTFAYETGGRKNINGLNCVIPPNAKVILVGANGAGKSTLLRILTGVIYLGLEHDEFDINGNATPHDQANGVAYLGGVWKRRRTGFEGIEPFSMDIAARDMMKKWQAENLERRDELVRVLGINLDWRMHECSDGQRKKVRIMLKLLRPFRLCVIDEFAADLDIFSRKRFFDYLTRECAARGASVVYATHIFDQADVWATHVAFMQLDKVLSPIHALATYAPYREILARTGADRAFCPMYVLVLEELERQYRDHSDFFTDDNQCLTDVIMASQAAEKEADAGEERLATKKNSGYEAGRLARAIAIDDMDEHRKERRAAEKRAEAEEAQRVVAY
jgi:CCR4-NOT complex subunit CAF16